MINIVVILISLILSRYAGADNKIYIIDFDSNYGLMSDLRILHHRCLFHLLSVTISAQRVV